MSAETPESRLPNSQVTVGQVTVSVEDPPNPDSARTVREGLLNYNRSKGEIGYVPVQVIARDAQNEICGGAIGYVVWGELYVDILWVDERVRGQGVGSRLMALVEERAQRHNCHRVFLGTMSHQAPYFYPKVGYIQFAHFPGKNGWPDRYHFYKDIPTQGDTTQGDTLQGASTPE